MIFSILHYLRGFLELRLHGVCLERFINLCVREGIYLWHIRKEGEQDATAYVSIPGFFRIRRAAQKTKTSVRILKKRGMPLFLHRHRRRRAFVAGILLFAVIVTFLSSFVWTIEIDGLEKTDENLVRNTLKSCGLDTGVIKYTLKASSIKDAMLRKMPELSWLWVEIRGTRAFVHVREKTPRPDIVPAHRPQNVVAKTDGVIESCTATRGTARVEQGDVVKKGALLISGTVETKHGGTLLVHAEGSVRARTWRTETDTFPLTHTTETDTGATKSRYGIRLGSFYLPLFGKNLPFASCRTEQETKSLPSFLGEALPFSFEKTTVYETIPQTLSLAPEEAVSLYGPQLREKMQMPEEAEVINTAYSHILNEDQTITISCTVECLEEIGENREILEETEDDREIF